MLYNKIEDTVYHKLDKHRPTRSAPHEQLGTELNSVGSTVFTGSPIGKDGAMSFQPYLIMVKGVGVGTRGCKEGW